MKKINFNKDWQFILEKDLDAYNCHGLQKSAEATGAPARFYDYNNWKRVELPHDWAVALPKSLAANTMAGARANTHYCRFFSEGRTNLGEVFSVGWYRKDFFLDEALEGKRVFIEFEGVFRDATVFVNGTYIDRHASGYTGFLLEITDQLVPGEDNSIAVRVDTEQPEGWWYEGAGIYRNVWLLIAEPLYFKHGKTVVKTALDGTVTASAVLVNDKETPAAATALWQILGADGSTVATLKTPFEIAPYGEAKISAVLKIDTPLLWSVDTPHLYTLQIDACDQVLQRFGVRTVELDPARGCLLNGKPLKLRGACVHQDFGGVGVALTDNLHRYKIALLKEMGVNAYRCAHHAPAPAILDACDELGMLVMDETRTFGTTPEARRQLTALIERDRNHPSVFIWSIGNEEFTLQNTVQGNKQAKAMCRLVRELDDTRPTTYGGNNGADFTGINGAVDVRGVNYIRNGKSGWLEEYRKDHPAQPIIGSEESSYVLSRGSATTDFGSGVLSCNGEVTMPWGSTPKGWVKFYEERPYLAGGFMWTGFDYRGEPNPYIYTHTSSFFGTIDLCGIPKPPFYYYKAWWTDSPVLKLLPHWSFKDGTEATVGIYTNCEQVTLTLNGREVATYNISPFDMITAKLPFEAGTLTATGIKNGEVYTDTLTTPREVGGLTSEVVLRGEKKGDISIVELRALDADGRFCPLAANEVTLTLPEGEIVGVCNGDPADMAPEQPQQSEVARHITLFENEKAEIYIVPPKQENAQKSRLDYLTFEDKSEGFADDYRVVAAFKNPKPTEPHTYTTRVSDAEAYEYIEFERFGGIATVYLNGERIGDNLRTARSTDSRYNRPYRFYCRFAEGENEIKVETRLCPDAATPFSGYVKLGRTATHPMTVRLHYGMARVFVRSTAPEALVAQLEK